MSDNISPALNALLNYGQADEDGVMCVVSRQAVHEVADEVAALRALNEELVGALAWAMPLASRALEDHRRLRLSCGHSDIGSKRVGLFDDEVAKEEQARAALARAKGGSDAR